MWKIRIIIKEYYNCNFGLFNGKLERLQILGSMEYFKNEPIVDLHYYNNRPARQN